MFNYIINNIRSYADYLINHKGKDPYINYRGKEWFTIAECKEIYEICNGLSVSERIEYALDDVMHDAYVTINDLNHYDFYYYRAIQKGLTYEKEKEKDFPKEVFQLKEGEWNYY